MNNWLSAILKTARRQNMFGRKRNNRGMIWASILGLGVSAAALGLRRNRNGNMLRPVQAVMNSMLTRNTGRMPNAAAMAEFSKELVPDKYPLTNK